MPKRRNPRVEQSVLQAVAELLEEVADPRVRLVTLTDARVSEDHKHATIFYTTIEPELVSRPSRATGDTLHDADAVAAGLASVAPRIQGNVARRLRLRNTPALVFEVDEVAAEGRRIEELLRRATQEQRGAGDGSEP